MDQILCALTNQKKENSYLQKQLISERYTYDKIITQLNDLCIDQNKIIAKLHKELRDSKQKSSISNKVLLKQNEQMVIELEEQQIKIKVMENKFILSEKEWKEKIKLLQKDLEQYQHEIKELSQQNAFYQQMKDDEGNGDLNDRSERSWIKTKIIQSQLEEIDIIQSQLQNQQRNSLQIATDIMNIIINVDDIDGKIERIKYKNNGNNINIFESQFFDLCNKAMTKLLNKQSQFKQIKIENQMLQNKLNDIVESENIDTFHQLKYKIERLTERCQFIQFGKESINIFKQFAITLKLFNNKIHEIGRKIRSLSISPQKRSSSLHHLSNNFQSIPKQRAKKLFNQLKQIFADNDRLKRDSFQIIQLIRNEGSIMTPNEYNQSIDDLGNTFLHKSIQISAVDIAKELLLHETDPNIQNIFGQSVLHLLCQKLHLHKKFMDLFISLINSNKTNLRIINNQNKTCLEMIQYPTQQREVINILQDATNNANIQFGIKQLREIIEKWIQKARNSHFS